MGSGVFEIKAARQSWEFAIIVRLSWSNQAMPDMKTFAQTLADVSKRNLAVSSDADKIQLHRARVLDAESRPFWQSVVTEVLAGIKEYESCLKETSLEQERTINKAADAFAVRWRYPKPQELTVGFEFERRLIILIKKNLNESGDGSKTLHLTVESNDTLIALDRSE